MKLDKFIQEHGGVTKLSKKLKVGQGRVSNWKTGRCLPDDKSKYRLVKLGKGKITYDEIINPFFEAVNDNRIH